MPVEFIVNPEITSPEARKYTSFVLKSRDLIKEIYVINTKGEFKLFDGKKKIKKQGRIEPELTQIRFTFIVPITSRSRYYVVGDGNSGLYYSKDPELKTTKTERIPGTMNDYSYYKETFYVAARDKVIAFDSNGPREISVDVEGNILRIDVNDYYLSLLTSERVYVYSISDGQLEYEFSIKSPIENVQSTKDIAIKYPYLYVLDSDTIYVMKMWAKSKRRSKVKDPKASDIDAIVSTPTSVYAITKKGTIHTIDVERKKIETVEGYEGRFGTIYNVYSVGEYVYIDAKKGIFGFISEQARKIEGLNEGFSRELNELSESFIRFYKNVKAISDDLQRLLSGSESARGTLKMRLEERISEARGRMKSEEEKIVLEALKECVERLLLGS